MRPGARYPGKVLVGASFSKGRLYREYLLPCRLMFLVGSATYQRLTQGLHALIRDPGEREDYLRISSNLGTWIRTMTNGIVVREAHFPGRPAIEAYGNGGFRFANMSHRGSILCLPSGVYGWQPVDERALTVGDFAGLLAEADDVEVLLVGTGRELKPLPSPLRAAFREARISADPMATGAAVRTYNVLLAEDRAVAAALIAVD
jgi:uncharacterized protein